MNVAFTLVYTFTARPVSMEMNFPHKLIRGQEPQAATLDADQRSAHEALLASVVARQAISPTARLFVSQQRGEKAFRIGVGKRSMEDRMHFFAGKSARLDRKIRGDSIFPRGSFHPGLFGEQSGQGVGKIKL